MVSNNLHLHFTNYTKLVLYGMKSAILLGQFKKYCDTFHKLILLPKCLTNFGAIGEILTPISRLRYFTTSCGKISVLSGRFLEIPCIPNVLCYQRSMCRALLWKEQLLALCIIAENWYYADSWFLPLGRQFPSIKSKRWLVEVTWDPFYHHGLTWIPAWINNAPTKLRATEKL